MTVDAQPPITRAQVEAAFDEIDEKYHLTGVRLRFADDRESFEVIIEPIAPIGS